jgi:hypothetical protein
MFSGMLYLLPFDSRDDKRGFAGLSDKGLWTNLTLSLAVLPWKDHG